jgi:rRNA-processing protein EBP2
MLFLTFLRPTDHMAKVKDRLIFENKKMEAVAQRKSVKEQKLRAREAHSNRMAEKARRKKDHFKAVQEWAQAAASSRGRMLDDDDGRFLRSMGGGAGKKGPNKKRQLANKKYGFGGKRGRFKQNTPETMNDMSGFNPQGNFGGMGTKRTAKSKSAGGANRKGKRARDAMRSRR